MKKFAFSLERVRDWREKQIAVEQSALERLHSERDTLEQRREAIGREADESAREVAHAPAVRAEQLHALDQLRRYAASQRVKIAKDLEGLNQRIDEQRARLIEARRRFELLDKLRERKWSEWNAELAREIEADAAEAYLAKRNNRST